MATETADDRRQTADELGSAVERLRAELAKALVGQELLIERLLVGMIAGGHLLLEGVPGLAKTLAARTLAAAIGARFQRIQFTPDLLPADLIGGEVYHPKTGEFAVRPGPIFTEVLLCDEINRAPAKVQSALLEAMQERQATIGGESRSLPELFFVLATQNPIEQEGTYPLPEAQVDRFLMKVVVDYPDRSEERRILDRMARSTPPPPTEAVIDPETVLALRRRVDSVYLDDKVREYILDVVRATRNPADYNLDTGPLVQLGASPRATIGLAMAAKAKALLDGREYVVPHDVKSLAPDVLRHRILTSFEAEAENVTADAVIERILRGLAVP